MRSRAAHWDAIVSNLARHLASVSDVDQLERILADADRDLAQLEAPPTFWADVSEAFQRALRTERSTRSLPAEVVRRRLAAMVEVEV